MKNIVDFYPSKSTFTDASDTAFYLTSFQSFSENASAQIRIYHLGCLLYSKTFHLDKGQRKQLLFIESSMLRINSNGQGFIAACDILINGSHKKTLHTAFDLNPSWAKNPRYGFLSDFYPKREDVNATIEELVKFHINGLQFYDWQYRHDQLLPDQSEYKDALGRRLSLTTIKQLMRAAHDYGIACMPYLAIYAASIKYWSLNKSSALYNADKKPIMFHDFLGLMDPSPQSVWAEHLAEECDRTLEKLPFDGLHIDQYGEPKIAYDAVGKLLDLPAAFISFINHVKEKHTGKTIVLNAVGNWPIEALCSSDQDFMYIEVWPPAVHYQDLQEIIRNAQMLSKNKPVVLAVYMPSSWKANIQLSNAIIFASGATRIEIGEHARYLSDPYFPKHQEISPSLYKNLRKYYDFAVAYSEWLKPCNRTPFDFQVTPAEGILMITNRINRRIILHLINTHSIQEVRWDKKHRVPAVIKNIQIKIPILNKPKQVQYASPDVDLPHLQPVKSSFSGKELKITIPKLKYWTMISIETENK